MSTMLYEGQRACLSRYVGPATGADRRRYQFTLMLPRAGRGAGVTVAAAWISLTRQELRELAQAIHGAEAAEDPEDRPDDKPLRMQPGDRRRSL